MAKDPVCGMQVDEHNAAARAEHQGVTFYFCSIGCHQKFLAAPGQYSSGGEGQHGGHARPPER